MRKLVFAGLLTLLFSICLGYLMFFGPEEVVWHNKIREGNRLVSSIETYRQRHNYPPLSLAELGNGDAESHGFFYERCSESRYVVWFGTTLGESMSYDSSTQKWEPLNTSCR